MNVKDLIPLYIVTLFTSLSESVVIPILVPLNNNYHLNGYYFLIKDLTISIGFFEAIFVFISTFSLIFWGYRADKTNRRPLFIIGLLIFIMGDMLIIFQPQNVVYYLIGRCFLMGIGIGALGPAAYSYTGDLLSFEKRSQINSTLSIIGIGGIGFGIISSGILSRFSLFLPFIILGLTGLPLMAILIMFPEPIRGKEEPEIKQVLDLNSNSSTKIRELEESYSRNINVTSLEVILKRKTNIFILIQGFFALMPSIIFSYYLISYLNDTNYGGVGLDLTLAILLGMGSASGRLLGFPFFGWLGDKLQFSGNEKFKNKGRALIPTVTMFVQAPLMISAFLIVLPALNNSKQVFPDFIFLYPQFIIFGILFFVGAFIGGGSGPNRSSIMFDVNEPELRGQTSSILAMGDQIGASIGLLLGNIFIVAFGYAHAFAFLSIGYLISGIFWLGAYKSIEKDEEELRLKINQRIMALK